MESDEAIATAQEIFSARCLDPSAVQFRNMSYEKVSGWVRGEYNAKNKVGGYNGFTGFGYNLKTKDVSTPKATSDSIGIIVCFILFFIITLLTIVVH